MWQPAGRSTPQPTGRPMSTQPKDPRIVRLVRPAMLDGKPIPREPDITVEVRVIPGGNSCPPPEKTLVPARFKRAPGETVNWHGMQPLHRANLLTLRELGLMFDVGAPAIVKHANKHGWERDPEGRAHARADDKVREALIQQDAVQHAIKHLTKPPEPLAPATGVPTDPNTDTSDTPQSDSNQTVNNGEQRVNKTVLVNANIGNSLAISNSIEAYADVIARVRLGQNERFKRVAALCMSMFEELEGQVANRPELAELGDMMLAPTEAGYDKLNDIYRKIIEFPGQVRAMKDLADVIGQLTTWETKAFRLETAPLDAASGKRKHLLVRFVDAPMVERIEPDALED